MQFWKSYVNILSEVGIIIFARKKKEISGTLLTQDADLATDEKELKLGLGPVLQTIAHWVQHCSY
jgi:hypothetical protein